ncbi:hypothetical protein HYT01_04420 [Candidatus Giovannonibacteria bacterium]|nr:hypothetical protein [Candidatus Giovannonibacteria bacterium]
MKAKGKVKIKWSPKFSYAIGLLTTDGCLSKDGRHIDFTSKDLDLIKIFSFCLGLKNKIGIKISGSGRQCGRVQFGDVIFYRFLMGLGLTPEKSKTMSDLDIPEKYFFDFLRGHFDGDGTFYSYYDPRWKNSFMFYTVFASASYDHLVWVRNMVFKLLKIKGHITHSKEHIVWSLKYAKKDSLKILKAMYYEKNITCLKRKHLKIKQVLGIIGMTI